MTDSVEAAEIKIFVSIVLCNLHHRVDRDHALAIGQDDQRIDVDAVELTAETYSEIRDGDDRFAQGIDIAGRFAAHAAENAAIPIQASSANEVSGVACRRITSRRDSSATNAIAGRMYAPRKPNAAMAGAEISGNSGDCRMSP